MSAEKTEQVDHKAEALRLLEWVGDPTDVTAANADDPRVEDVLAVATIRSNLAIAEGQERVAEEVKRVADALEAGNREVGPWSVVEDQTIHVTTPEINEAASWIAAHALAAGANGDEMAALVRRECLALDAREAGND